MGTKVVVGVDGSPASGVALRWAASFASRVGGTLHVLGAWQTPSGWGGADISSPEVLEDLESFARQVVDDAVDAVHASGGPGIDVTSEVVEGPPARRLIEAGQSADLLVVGNIGHSRLTGLMLGSVADAVVRHATCPVAVIPMDR